MTATRRSGRAWLVAAAAAVILGALWLRTWDQPYLIGTSVAIVLAAVLGARLARPLFWLAAIASLAGFAALGWRAQAELIRIEREWPEVERSRTDEGARAFDTIVRRDFVRLKDAATRALDIPEPIESRFAALEELLPNSSIGEVSGVVFEARQPTAWIGAVRLDADSLVAPSGIAWGDFYVVAYATAQRGERRTVLMRTLLAHPPANRIARSTADVIARSAGIRRYELSPTPEPGLVPVGDGPVTLAWLRPIPFGSGEALLRAQERTGVLGAIALALAFLAAMAAAWRRPAPLWHRFAMLGAGLGLVALIPLNSLSNLSALFDPSNFFALLGGPFTASVGAFALTSALGLLAVFALQRAKLRIRSRSAALLMVLAVAAAGPFLLRDLAGGITPPTRGAPTTIWIAWEVALFLAATAILLAGASAGRAALRGARGVAPVVAPVLAAIAALFAPVLWEVPGRWPAWYPVPWILAVAALALARRSRAFVFNASLVAACGASVLVWGAVARKSVQLAERDVASLEVADPETQRLLARFADDLQRVPTPRTRTELLKLYVASDLAASGSPMELASWRVGASGPDAELRLGDYAPRAEGERSIVHEVALGGRALIREVQSVQGMHSMLGVPGDSGLVVTVVVAPRTRLIAEDPFSALLGLEEPLITEPPYRLAIAPISGDADLGSRPRWERKDDEFHGDWRIGGASGFVRAHVEVELRSLDALVQRGALLVLIDLMVLALLWVLSAAADGALWRWARLKVRRWRGSYRTRLSFALFGAFVLPAAAFATWTYQRLQDEDRLSRELLVRETLRAAAASSDFGRLREEGRRLDTPLFLYAGGRLSRSSDEIYDALAPLGLYLDPIAAQSVTFGDEVSASRRIAVAGVQTLIGYRVVMDTPKERIVLAAPARRNELTLERQRRDLGVLVVFVTALGALAALWMSGVAARGFARPIGALREAALDVASGARTLPVLGVVPPNEFQPVYSAFRQMAHDLGESRDALEAAQRRTEAVLRNVASGVIACDAEGRVMLANARAERIVGAPLLGGDTLARRGAPEIQARVNAFVRSAIAEESFEVEIRGRQVRARLTRLPRGDGGAVLTLDDVTELARAERVFAWGEMARQVAHEIKNPLTPIRLGVQHLRRAHADARDDFSEILERNVSRILQEIDRLDEIARAFSKFGTLPGERPPGLAVDASAIVRDVVALERMGESNVVWELSGDETPVSVISRADELREVLLNVMENARHANARHVLSRIERNHERILIVVEDDGDGIPDDALPRVFEPHFSTRTSGSGLGLAISKRMVESWGGAIHIERAPRRGTIVRLTLVPAPSP